MPVADGRVTGLSAGDACKFFGGLTNVKRLAMA